jgi:hypothetical protein
MLDAAELAAVQDALAAVFTALLKPVFSWRHAHSYYF